ncbi:hypothetical protein [Salimicrobium album]|uniref:Uncharacterized protein n=1 Tax=Salimicrobium album TaxID=50717 RepID=A0A1H3E529_9BACI|nr:hypothetical protein [Salimicrobium album]SDX73720.1 hypothetical protein SAMN04488081_1250 [Salimicrobium album]
MNEEKIRHLEMIQPIISRMAANSFYLKGWAVTLVTALLTYKSTQTIGGSDLIIFILPIVVYGSMKM